MIVYWTEDGNGLVKVMSPVRRSDDSSVGTVGDTANVQIRRMLWKATDPF